MTITTLDGLIGAPKQILAYARTTSVTAVAANHCAIHQAAGVPGATALAVGDTAAGLVPTDAYGAAVTIDSFGAGATGYLTRAVISSSVSSNVWVYDRLFHAGAFPYNANVALADQPSFASRVPNGDYRGLELWFEAVTAHTGNISVTVTYTNQDGTPGQSTGAVAWGAAPAVGRSFRLPLAAGDSGIQKIESVVATVASAGTFNLYIARHLVVARLIGSATEILAFDRTGMPVVYPDSCIIVRAQPDSTATGNVNALLEISNG